MRVVLGQVSQGFCVVSAVCFQVCGRTAFLEAQGGCPAAMSRKGAAGHRFGSDGWMLFARGHTVAVWGRVAASRRVDERLLEASAQHGGMGRRNR